MGENRAMQDWIASRPPSVRKLAAEFPPGTRLVVKGVVMHLVGYTEDDDLLVSSIDPHVDYHRAYAARQPLCAEHVRSGEVGRAPESEVGP